MSKSKIREVESPVRSARARLRSRLRLWGDRGLATTETVILTAFLVIVASAGGWIIYNSMNSNAAGIQNSVNYPSPGGSGSGSGGGSGGG